MPQTDPDNYYICLDGPLIGRKIQESPEDPGDEFMVPAGDLINVPRSIFEDPDWEPEEGEAYIYQYERDSNETVALLYVQTINYDPEIHG